MRYYNTYKKVGINGVCLTSDGGVLKVGEEAVLELRLLDLERQPKLLPHARCGLASNA
jgi:hypothetical protein